MKRRMLLIISAIFASLFLVPVLYASEKDNPNTLYSSDSFRLEKKMVLTWDTPEGERIVELDNEGAKKLRDLAEEAKAKGGNIEPEFLYEGKVKTDFIEPAEGEYRLRVDYYVMFWRSGAYKSYFMISPVTEKEKPEEGFGRRFMVFHHHSELLEKGKLMIRDQEGKPQLADEVPSDEWGREFLDFLKTLNEF
jgi:hypothetical protein